MLFTETAQFAFSQSFTQMVEAAERQQRETLAELLCSGVLKSAEEVGRLPYAELTARCTRVAAEDIRGPARARRGRQGRVSRNARRAYARALRILGGQRRGWALQLLAKAVRIGICQSYIRARLNESSFMDQIVPAVRVDD